MPPADLTRFDFHVVRFMNSYDVEVMTDSEIGQYILLLCKSWLLAREATLPDDSEYLARVARATGGKVSDRVLAKFPVVETEFGNARRNPVLFEEWLRASERSETSREMAEKRWNKSGKPVLLTSAKNHATADAKASTNADTLVSVSLMPKPNQTDSTQTNPTQPKDVTGAVDSGQEQPEPQNTGMGDWKTLAVQHKRLFNKKAAVKYKEQFYNACQQYGEKVVLTCFGEWAETAREWVVRENINLPLAAFFKKLPELAADEIEVSEAEQALAEQEAAQRRAEEQRQQTEQKQIDESIAIQKRMHKEFWEKEPPPQNGADIDEFFKVNGLNDEK